VESFSLKYFGGLNTDLSWYFISHTSYYYSQNGSSQSSSSTTLQHHHSDSHDFVPTIQDHIFLIFLFFHVSCSDPCEGEEATTNMKLVAPASILLAPLSILRTNVGLADSLNGNILQDALHSSQFVVR
jgi:hypothetical protein